VNKTWIFLRIPTWITFRTLRKDLLIIFTCRTVSEESRSSRNKPNSRVLKVQFGPRTWITAHQTSADSTVRVMPLSRFCPKLCKKNVVRCLSGSSCLDSEFQKKNCPLSACPAFHCLCPPMSAAHRYNSRDRKCPFLRESFKIERTCKKVISIMSLIKRKIRVWA